MLFISQNWVNTLVESTLCRIASLAGTLHHFSILQLILKSNCCKLLNIFQYDTIVVKISTRVHRIAASRMPPQARAISNWDTVQMGEQNASLSTLKYAFAIFFSCFSEITPPKWKNLGHPFHYFQKVTFKPAGVAVTIGIHFIILN